MIKSLVFLSLYLFVNANSKKLNIIFIVADDLGWNDVGFHGSNEIPTPNIDALAFSGIALHNYYVTPICTPSRAALMTGKYPIHNGMQHATIYGMEPRGLPLTEKILPQYLKELNYKTHLVGKWHLGSYRKEYLPLNRGFDSHLGFWTGKIDYYDHTNMERGTWGHDFRRDKDIIIMSNGHKGDLYIGFQVAYDLYGQYATNVYTKEAVNIIKNHNTSEPLFLMIAHSAVHSGNPYTPLRAPSAVIERFDYIANPRRRKFAGMLSKLDDSVGKVVAALNKQGMLSDSIIIFSTDNGGPADGFNDNAASNYPLKGVKNTLWEGGVRGAGLIWSPKLTKLRRVAKQRMHLVDWLPTLYNAAGGNSSIFTNIDGIDLWKSLSMNLGDGRNTIVHNIDDIFGSASISHGKWKLHKGTNYNGEWDYWYGPSGRSLHYDSEAVIESLAGKALISLSMLPDVKTMLKLRKESTIQCKYDEPEIECKPLKAPCLFNIEADPCERRNMAQLEPETLQNMLSLLDSINATAVEPNNKPDDPHGDPKYWGRVFTNFYDYESPDLKSSDEHVNKYLLRPGIEPGTLGTTNQSLINRPRLSS